MTTVDADSVAAGYDDVRSDQRTDVNWMVLKYEGNQIINSCTGDSFEELQEQFKDDERAFVYLRINTGDEMSKRTKFALLIWLGPEVSVLKKARMSTDRALVKQIIQNFSVEIMLESRGELDLEYLRSRVEKAGGSVYGTGHH
ncbi:Coactosin-like protein [Amphibalanus amphitrite]|uniref:Coactosin-like protein n=1 Tax=Amphibalanus amphitrite TaxID=1232801 RepID=A0A6A4VB34_AMPAM|nr:coactosin-like protein [Amphibalanus amphitrite]XP_043198182.1 coactosin-like protein [Amphibalanus amphitrite]KAF0291736.1 Coactosin-like protein [Amphibalanus amphitrite]